ncbi:MAG: SMP-30/gluconolactonase/LRE family protein [Piscirickettsiaceae bacterium]|nr:SMP-30/gluconolactonase/LRE family protein [Piscirickettsiaceae bacterium]
MKLITSWLLMLLPTLTLAATPILLPAWKSDTVFEQPESVVYDSKRQLLYVSNVNGNPNDVDGNGYISQLSLDGDVIELHWLEGLNAPKGMILVGDTLYVADINELIEIDIKNNKINQRYLAPNAKFLNDVTADSAGNVYVSDMLTNTIHCLCSGDFSIWLQDDQLEAPNGLLVEGNHLIVGSWGNMTDGFSTAIAGHLKTIDLASKHINSLGDKTPAGNLDGVEADGNGNYYVTDWMIGKLLHITPSGISTTLLSLEQGSADHTILAKQGLIIIPMMLSGNVLAYKIK